MKGKKYPYTKAKELIESICAAAKAGEYDTREKFLAMLDANPDIAAQGYNAFGKIFFWNRSSAHLYGYSETAAFNKNIFDLILPPELRQFAKDLILSASKTNKMPEPSAVDVLQHDGEYVTIFSGHIMFRWGNSVSPEFYCVDISIEPLT